MTPDHSKRTDPPTPAELLELASEAARAAGRLVRERRAAGVHVADTKTSATDVVTEADRASQAVIRELVLSRRPDDGFLGEEGDDIAGRSSVRWVVDPIDGTVNFLYGLPVYAVSVAAEVDGEVVAGVVLNAATGVEYAATLGGGATRDGTPIRVNPDRPLAQRLVATGFGYAAEARALQVDAWTRLLPRVRDLRRVGAAALDLCMVADGSVDAYLEEGVNPWDYAAGALVAREAGARTRLRPGRWGGEAIVCAPAAGYEAFVALVDEIVFFGE